MPSDWKKTIENWLERQKLEKEAVAEQDKITREENIKAQEKVSREAKLKVLAETFSCFICGKKSAYPKMVSAGGYLDTGGLNDHYVDRWADDWSQPGDLEKCEDCHRLACHDHYKDGRCIKCWSIKINQPLSL